MAGAAAIQVGQPENVILARGSDGVSLAGRLDEELDRRHADHAAAGKLSLDPGEHGVGDEGEGPSLTSEVAVDVLGMMRPNSISQRRRQCLVPLSGLWDSGHVSLSILDVVAILA